MQPQPAPRRRPRAPASPFLLVVFLAAALGLFAPGSLASAPPLDAGRLCHTDNPDECYPKVFQPTTEFQKVHDDQDLPPGLHVRLNVWTGEKEAKLNDPHEQNPALAGLPVDKAVVLIDPETPTMVSDASLPPGAPTYESVGLVKAPDHEAPAFYDALSILKTDVLGSRHLPLGTANVSDFDGALENLKELSHDIYYGMKIAEDEAALAALLCLMSTKGVVRKGVTVERARQAASIISAAVQNNPTALRHVEKSWDDLSKAQCSAGVRMGILVFGSFLGVEPCVDDGCRESNGALAKAQLSAINGLLKSDTIKADFLASQGMTHILNLLVATDAAYHDAQVKAANLVMDNFLDEDMGATLGLWPRTTPAPASECASGQHALREACWNAEMGRLAIEHSGSEPQHWSVPLWALLKGQRKGAAGMATAAGRDEL